MKKIMKQKQILRFKLKIGSYLNFSIKYENTIPPNIPNIKPPAASDKKSHTTPIIDKLFPFIIYAQTVKSTIHVPSLKTLSDSINELN